MPLLLAGLLLVLTSACSSHPSQTGQLSYGGTGIYSDSSYDAARQAAMY